MTKSSLLSRSLSPHPMRPSSRGLGLQNQLTVNPFTKINWSLTPYGNNYIGPDSSGIFVIDTSSDGNNLVGNSNNNYMIGLWGNDNLYGNGGDDYLNGYGTGTNGNGGEEYDVLTGDFWYSQPGVQGLNDGADTFALGSASETFYLSQSHGGGYAVITDFYWAEGDRVDLHGSLSDYHLDKTTNVTGNGSLDTQIFYQGALIGIVQDTTNFYLQWDANFLGGTMAAPYDIVSTVTPQSAGGYVVDASSDGNYLVGDSGNNTMIGLWGDDNLYGNAGNDMLDGYGHGTNGNGNEEYDILTGDYWFSEPGIQGVSDGADTFALGSAYEVYYIGSGGHSGGHALVTDFNAGEGDRIQLHGTGNLADYTLNQGSSVAGNAAPDTQIFYQGNLIGILKDTTDFSLATDVNFV